MTCAQLFGAEFAATVLRAALGWLLTYGLHAVVAALLADVLVRLVRLSPADEHRLWKMALVLPLATACLAMLFGGAAFGRTTLSAWPGLVRTQASHQTAAALAPGAPSAALMLALAATVGVVVGAARFAVGFARLRRRLHDRRASVDPRLRASLARMSARFALGPVELTESELLATPIAVGRRAICFPAGSTAVLADEEIDAVLAHELAHLERRDPTWFFFAGLVQGTLWLQPLNHRVVARLRRSAEIACDERAVAATGDALGLARGLSSFAHAALGAPAWADAHPSFGGAGPGSHALVDRVRRLAAAASAPLPSRAGTRRFQATAAVLALVIIGSAKVSVTFGAPPAAVATGAVAPSGAGDQTGTLGGFLEPPATSPLGKAQLRQRDQTGTLGRFLEPPAMSPLGEAQLRQRDVAAANQRVAVLAVEEARLQSEMGAAQAAAERASTAAGPSHLLELEQDLRHVRAERAWLERSANNLVRP